LLKSLFLDSSHSQFCLTQSEYCGKIYEEFLRKEDARFDIRRRKKALDS